MFKEFKDKQMIGFLEDNLRRVFGRSSIVKTSMSRYFPLRMSEVEIGFNPQIFPPTCSPCRKSKSRSWNISFMELSVSKATSSSTVISKSTKTNPLPPSLPTLCNAIIQPSFCCCWPSAFGRQHPQQFIRFLGEPGDRVRPHASKDVLNAQLDASIAKQQVNETIGIGLPQINGKFDVQDFVKIPTSVIPGEFFGEPAGTYIPVQFGTQWQANAGISASQLLFEPSYIIGVQASRTISELSQRTSNDHGSRPPSPFTRPTTTICSCLSARR